MACLLAASRSIHKIVRLGTHKISLLHTQQRRVLHGSRVARFHLTAAFMSKPEPDKSKAQPQSKPKGIQPENAPKKAIQDPIGYPRVELFRSDRDFMLVLSTVFCIVNAAFWLISTGLILDAVPPGLLRRVLPYMISFVSFLPFLMRWIYGQSYVTELVVEPGWKSIKLKHYNGFLRAKKEREILLDDIERYLTRDSPKDIVFKAKQNYLHYLVDKKKGKVFDAELLKQLLTKKKLAPEPSGRPTPYGR